MATMEVVEPVDVLGNGNVGGFPAFEVVEVIHLALERREEALGHSVVPAITLPAHAAFNALHLQGLPVIATAYVLPRSEWWTIIRAKIRFMQAYRALLETDENGHLNAVPPLPSHAKVEAIFLVLDAERIGRARTPPPELAALRIIGDVVAPAVELQDWHLDG